MVDAAVSCVLVAARRARLIVARLFLSPNDTDRVRVRVWVLVSGCSDTGSAVGSLGSDSLHLVVATCIYVTGDQNVLIWIVRVTSVGKIANSSTGVVATGATVVVIVN